MIGNFTINSKFSSLKYQLPFVCILVVVAVLWRYMPFMPQVFYGDDLFYLLAFKDNQCGAVASQLLTTVCADKYRPLPAAFILLLFYLFDSAIHYYMAINVFLQTVSAVLVFVIACRFSKNNLIVAVSITMAIVVSRFATYQTTQVIGPVEALALPLFLGVIYALLCADERKEETLKWGWVAISLSFLLIHNHERYIVIAAWLFAAFILMPNFYALPKRHLVCLLGGCVALPLFYVGYKTLVLNSPFMVGTGGTHLTFDLQRIFLHIKQAALSIAGFNEGPDYLVGIDLTSLPWYPAGYLAVIFAMTTALTICLGIYQVFDKQQKLISFLFAIRWPILLVMLAIFLLVPAVSTIRVEQRWLFAPFILMLLFTAWSAGRQENTARFPISLLVVTLSISSIILDSVIMKHFNQVFFVSNARFAEIVKRDIADKYPGHTSAVYLLSRSDYCDWALLKGGFFRIYGGTAREVSCVSLNDVASINNDINVQVFAELTPGYLSDITNEWQTRAQANRGRVLFDFINEFKNGHINSLVKVDTPSGMGVLVLPATTQLGIENTITVISGFSYRFDDVLIEQDAELRFGLSMIYPAEPVKAIIYVVENDKSQKRVLFSQEVKSPDIRKNLMFTPVSIPLTAYSGKRISLVFTAEPTGADISGQWLGYSNPQIFLPREY